MKLSDNPEYITTTEGYLNVCLCEKTCNHHERLEDLLKLGTKVLIHVKDEDGKIVPLRRI